MEQSKQLMNRRDALGRLACIGGGALTIFRADPWAAAAQAVPLPSAPGPNPRFPNPPTWEKELRELAPNVYGYFQGGGPGRDNVSVSDAGVIVGDDGLMVIDTTTAPIHAKAFHRRHPEGDRQAVSSRDQHAPSRRPHHRQPVLRRRRDRWPPVLPRRGREGCECRGPAFWAKREGWADGTEPRKILPPVTTFDGKMTYYYGQIVVEVFPMLPAHTYGDLVVLPAAAQDLVCRRRRLLLCRAVLPERASEQLD